MLLSFSTESIVGDMISTVISPNSNDNYLQYSSKSIVVDFFIINIIFLLLFLAIIIIIIITIIVIVIVSFA